MATALTGAQLIMVGGNQPLGVMIFDGEPAPDTGGGGGSLLLLETGSPDNLLLETGDAILLES